jgi:hypothetical protein
MEEINSSGMCTSVCAASSNTAERIRAQLILFLSSQYAYLMMP